VRRVLIVSFHFPPANTIAALRVGKFAKYLPEFGWKPLVLTVNRNDVVPQTLAVEISADNVLRTPYWDFRGMARRFLRTYVKSTPAIVKSSHTSNRLVVRALYRFIRRRLPLSDDRLIDFAIGWYPYAVRAIQRIMQDPSHQVDVIFSSCGPPTVHLIASSIHRRFHIPWVADFRDLWSLNHTVHRPYIIQILEERIERITLRGAAHLVTVSEVLADQLRAFHRKDVTVIPNGFDEEDYDVFVQPLERLTITYTGNINDIQHRNPSVLFAALARLKACGLINRETFCVRFVGFNLDGVAELADKFGVQDLVELLPPVPYERSVVLQKESAALLLLEWNHPSAAGVTTGKVFEYLGARRPILAICYPNGAIASLLQKTGAGVVATGINDVECLLKRWIKEWTTRKTIMTGYKPCLEQIRQYTRRAGAKRLGRLLNEVVAKQRRQ